MAPRPHRALAWRVATPVVGLLSGGLFVVSAHSSEGTDLRPGRFTDLASLVQYDAQRGDNPNKRVTDLTGQVTLLSGSVDDQRVRKFNRQSAAVKDPAGLTPV